MRLTSAFLVRVLFVLVVVWGSLITALLFLGPRFTTSPPVRVIPDAGFVVVCQPSQRVAAYQLGIPVFETWQLLDAVSSIADFMRARYARTVILFGLQPDSTDFAASLHQISPMFRVAFVYTGGSEMRADESGQLELLTRSPEIWRVGFFSPTVAGIFKPNEGFLLRNLKRSFQARPGKLSFLDGRFHVAIFSDEYSQSITAKLVAGACMLGGVVVHVVPATDKSLVPPLCSLVQQGQLNHLEQQTFMASMDVVFYVNSNEPYPMTVLESLSVGTPCICNNFSKVYDSDPFLQSSLVLAKLDAVHSIFNLLSNAKGNLARIMPSISRCLENNNKEARLLWGTFLNFALLPEYDLSFVDQSYPMIHPISNRVPFVPPDTKIVSLTSQLTICHVTTSFEYLAAFLSSSGNLSLNERHVLLVDMESATLPTTLLSVQSIYKLDTILQHFSVDEGLFRSMPVVPPALEKRFPFYHKSVQLAQAISYINSQERCHIVEFSDRGGLAYELLRDTKSYVGDSVVALRMIGPSSITHLASTALVEDTAKLNRDFTLTFLMEMFSIRQADFLIASAPQSLEFYQKFFNFSARTILDPILIDTPEVYLSSRSSFTRYVVYGPQSIIACTKYLISTAVKWINLDKVPVQFVFYGDNAMPECADRKCLQDLIPSTLSSRFSFLDISGKHQLGEAVANTRCLVIPYPIEPFITTEHEATLLRVPTIVPSVALFTNLRSTEQTFFFNLFDEESLILAFRNSYRDTKKIDAISSTLHSIPKTQYSQSIYQNMLAQGELSTTNTVVASRIHQLFEATVDPGTAQDPLPFY